MFKNRCYNGGNRHQFEAVYTEQPNPVLDRFSDIKAQGIGSVKRLIYLETYLGHVCKWCGKVVKIEGGTK